MTGTVAFPGVREALAALAAAGHGLGVCTQKPNAPAVTILRALGLMPPIAALTGGDSLDVMKPDPRMLAHAAAQLPEGPVIFVGDSEVDAATAEAAGVPFLLHTEGYPGAAAAGCAITGPSPTSPSSPASSPACSGPTLRHEPFPAASAQRRAAARRRRCRWPAGRSGSPRPPSTGVGRSRGWWRRRRCRRRRWRG